MVMVGRNPIGTRSPRMAATSCGAAHPGAWGGFAAAAMGGIMAGLPGTTDRRMTGEVAALAVAAELARFIRHCGSGEMPSPAAIARPAKLNEDGAIEGVNALIYRGFIALVYAPGFDLLICFSAAPAPIKMPPLRK